MQVFERYVSPHEFLVFAFEILLIPGVGDRMAHEFEEYRPYDGIERFRREIGKYVDANEVARLEQYVTIK